MPIYLMGWREDMVLVWDEPVADKFFLGCYIALPYDCSMGASAGTVIGELVGAMAGEAIPFKSWFFLTG